MTATLTLYTAALQHIETLTLTEFTIQYERDEPRSVAAQTLLPNKVGVNAPRSAPTPYAARLQVDGLDYILRIQDESTTAEFNGYGNKPEGYGKFALVPFSEDAAHIIQAVLAGQNETLLPYQMRS